MFKIRQRQGRLLSSPRDSRKEAREWLGRQTISETNSVIVLGFGSGFHLEVLLEQFPSKKFICLELDKEIFQDISNEVNLNGRIEILNELNVKAVEKFQKLNVQILSFRPSWQGLEQEYLNLYIRLNARTVESFVRHCQELGLVDSANSLGILEPKLPISIKTITDSPNLAWPQASQELKVWRCLRELVA